MKNLWFSWLRKSFNIWITKLENGSTCEDPPVLMCCITYKAPDTCPCLFYCIFLITTWPYQTLNTCKASVTYLMLSRHELLNFRVLEQCNYCVIGLYSCCYRLLTKFRTSPQGDQNEIWCTEILCHLLPACPLAVWNINYIIWSFRLYRFFFFSIQ